MPGVALRGMKAMAEDGQSLGVVVKKGGWKKGSMKGKGGPQNSACQYRGVRQRTWGKWVAEIREPKKKMRLWLGSFATAREAALAYDEAARRLYGSMAHLNLPDWPPPKNEEGARIAMGNLEQQQRDENGQNNFARQVDNGPVPSPAGHMTLRSSSTSTVYGHGRQYPPAQSGLVQQHYQAGRKFNSDVVVVEQQQGRPPVAAAESKSATGEVNMEQIWMLYKAGAMAKKEMEELQKSVAPKQEWESAIPAAGGANDDHNKAISLAVPGVTNVVQQQAPPVATLCNFSKSVSSYGSESEAVVPEEDSNTVEGDGVQNGGLAMLQFFKEELDLMDDREAESDSSSVVSPNHSVPTDSLPASSPLEEIPRLGSAPFQDITWAPQDLGAEFLQSQSEWGNLSGDFVDLTRNLEEGQRNSGELWKFDDW